MEGTAIVVAVYLIALVILLGIVGRPVYIALRERMSPKYAAARKLRLTERNARVDAARKQARADAVARLQRWATEHPDDETAQAYLASYSTVEETSSDELDPQKALAERQDSDDTWKRQRAERKAAETLVEQQLFEWALANPATKEGNRHLKEVLKTTEADVALLESKRVTAEYHCSTTSTDEQAAESYVSELEALLAAAREKLQVIQEALATVNDGADEAA